MLLSDANPDKKGRFMTKVLCVLPLIVLLASCGEAPKQEPAKPPASSTAAPTLSTADKETVDNLGGDLKGLARVMGNAMTVEPKRAYAKKRFLKALEASGRDDLPLLSELSGLMLSDEVRGAIEEKQKTLK